MAAPTSATGFWSPEKMKPRMKAAATKKTGEIAQKSEVLGGAQLQVGPRELGGEAGVEVLRPR